VIDQVLLKRCSETVLQQMEIVATKQLLERVAKNARNALDSALRLSSATSLKRGQAEFTLTMPLDGDYLSGTMDLVVSDNGEVEVWDWKTNNLNRKSADELFEYYDPQLRAYSFLLLNKYPSQPSIRSRIIFTRTGEVRTLSLQRSEVMAYGSRINEIIRSIKTKCFLI
jgi:ATP-dependent exoDNAse (exonuclease V) beta subunit